jgi:hypothetical protein
MNPEIDTLGIAILKGACNAESKDIAMDLGQLELASLLGEEVLKEIPVIKGIVALYKIPIAIRDQLFIRKVAGFLSACPTFTATEKETFINEHLADNKKATKLGESLVLILDRLDDMDKPQMIAKAFAAFVRGKINIDIFRRLATAIDMGSIDDFREFIKMEPLSRPRTPRGVSAQTQILRSNLVRTGLVSLPNFSGITPILGVTFRENDLGKAFREIMNDTTVENPGQREQNP